MILFYLSFSFLFSWYDISDIDDKKLAEAFYQNKSLKIEYLRAMQDFLSGNTLEAEQKFSLIIMKTYDYNWSYEDRKLIVYSHLRFCQTQEDHCQRMFEDIAKFDSNMIAHIDDAVFSPPMIEQAMLAKSRFEKSRYLWRPNHLWQDAKFLLVNGKIYPMAEDLVIALNMNRVRVVKVNSDYEGETFVGTTKDLLNYRPQKVAPPSLKKSIKKDPVAIMGISELKKEDQDRILGIKKKNFWIYSAAGALITYLIYENKKDKARSGSTIHTSKN